MAIVGGEDDPELVTLALARLVEDLWVDGPVRRIHPAR